MPILAGVPLGGASNDSGVVAVASMKYGPQVETFHCLAQRLELGVHDALKSVNATNHFKIFLSTLHSLFSQSPKKPARAEGCCL